MHNYRSNGRECFYYILRKWDKIIVGAILIALLFGVFRGFKTYRSWDQDKADIEDLHRRYDEYMTIYQPEIDMYNNNITEKQNAITDYYQMLCEAEVIRFDDNNTGIAAATLYFDSTSEEELPEGTVALFTDVLVNSIDWESVAQAGDTDTNFIERMLVITGAEDAGNVITLKYFGRDDEAALDMLTEILDQAADIKADLADQIDGFDYSVVNLSSYTGRDGNYVAIKTEIQNQYNVLQIELSNLYKNLDEVEGPPELRDMPSRRQIAFSIVKHCIFGGVMGVAFMAAVFYLLFYLNGMLHSTEELSFYSDSQAMAYDSKKKRFAKLNTFLAKKENRGILYSQADAVSRTVANIKSKYPDVSKVMVTGNGVDCAKDSIKKALESTKDIGLNIKVENNILTDKGSFESIKDYDAVVVVEELDKSSVELIKREVEQIRIAGKEVVGALIAR
ncbi:hypothetical protein SAMN06296952_1031 [Oscillospiraceae bacterium]|nr:hypothetical protein SAMN06296952_1031 [Oscillospiraceae bacterium]